MIPTKPGIYENLTYEEYAAIQAVSRSLLAALASTPADAQQFLLGGGETTKALEFGIGSHCLMLEPKRFDAEFRIGPDVKLNTKEGKAEWAAFTEKHQGKTHIRGADGLALLGMRDRLFQHPLASRLLTANGANEVVIVWRDGSSGLLCKLRLDRLIKWEGAQAIVDYKTTADASRRGFPRSYGDYLYYMQEAFYCGGVQAVIGEPVPSFFFIAQEKKAPYKANVFRFPSYRVEQGRKLYRDLLEVYAACEKSGQWPAIDGREYLADVIEADVPAFSMRDAD